MEQVVAQTNRACVDRRTSQKYFHLPLVLDLFPTTARKQTLVAQTLCVLDPLRSEADAAVEEQGFERFMKRTKEARVHKLVNQKFCRVAMVAMVAMM